MRERGGTKLDDFYAPIYEAHTAEAMGSGALIVYDGDCPFCSSYVALTRLRQGLGPIRIINAREGGVEVDRLMREGYDLNQGMAFIWNGRVHHGARAVHMMAILSTRSDLFNRVVSRLFASEFTATVIYPLLRAGRNLVLLLLRRPKLPRPTEKT